MAISSIGIGSGLDLNSLVDQLLVAERKPQENRLDRREASLQARLSAFGSMRSNLFTLETALSKLVNLEEGRTATSSDPARLAALATGNVATGRYTIQIDQLAQAQSLASTTGFDSPEAVVGTGTLSLAVGGADAVDIRIDASNNSLQGIRDAINGSGADVQASIVNDGTGSRLVLSSNTTGAANTISLTVSDGDGDSTDMTGLSRLAAGNMEEGAAARDASAIINGLTVTSTSNTLDNTIEGLTLDLKGTTEAGSPLAVDVGQNRGALKSALNAFIEAYNAVVGQINDQTRFNPETREAALLVGDSTARSVRGRLSMALTQMVGSLDGMKTSVVSLGVRSDDRGLLSLDSGALEKALDRDLPGAVTLANEMAGAMRDAVRGFTERGGLLDNRTDGLQQGIRDIGRQREALENRMAGIEARLVRQFSAMDALVGQLQNTSQFLDQQLGALNAMLTQNRRG